jgi:GrpB-like predicted nucleotidyltransferase (UPF0157 family)
MAVPGLCSKPTIDILTGVKDLKDEMIITSLESFGYIHQLDAGEPDRIFFCKGSSRNHHIHVVKLQSWTFWRYIIFRDYVLSYPEICARYGDLKRAIAESYRHDMTTYTESKIGFIESTMKKATLE